MGWLSLDELAKAALCCGFSVAQPYLEPSPGAVLLIRLAKNEVSELETRGSRLQWTLIVDVQLPATNTVGAQGCGFTKQKNTSWTRHKQQNKQSLDKQQLMVRKIYSSLEEARNTPSLSRMQTESFMPAIMLDCGC